MKRTVIVFTILSVLFLIAFRVESNNNSRLGKFPSYDPLYPPPPNTPDVFELSQEYPDTFDVTNKYPWTEVDFKTHYKEYMKAVLSYCLEGNLDVDFKVQDNKVRKWYHAPWLHYSTNGREFYHGLTRERDVPAYELDSPTQNIGLENWAVGFYNSPGGYTLGKVWLSGSAPDCHLAEFPEGTVSFKLLFTAGTEKQVPFLKGTKQWKANIFNCNPDALKSTQKAACIAKRMDSTVRLLQIDIAVKDKRAGETGWVFGTFIYDGAHKGKDVWERMVPVGLMWGDDEHVDTMIHRAGGFVNPYLKQTMLNTELIRKKGEDSDSEQAIMSHHGLGGRLNGPVDNPISSCISCHSKSAVMDTGRPAPMADFSATPQTYPLSAFHQFFSTIKSGTGILVMDTIKYNKLDYSLQLAAGIRNYYQSLIDKKKTLLISRQVNKKAPSPGFTKSTPASSAPRDLPEVTRDGLKKEQ